MQNNGQKMHSWLKGKKKKRCSNHRVRVQPPLLLVLWSTRFACRETSRLGSDSAVAPVNRTKWGPWPQTALAPKKSGASEPCVDGGERWGPAATGAAGSEPVSGSWSWSRVGTLPHSTSAPQRAWAHGLKAFSAGLSSRLYQGDSNHCAHWLGTIPNPNTAVLNWKS